VVASSGACVALLICYLMLWYLCSRRRLCQFRELLLSIAICFGSNIMLLNCTLSLRDHFCKKNGFLSLILGFFLNVVINYAWK